MTRQTLSAVLLAGSCHSSKHNKSGRQIQSK